MLRQCQLYRSHYSHAKMKIKIRPEKIWWLKNSLDGNVEAERHVCINQATCSSMFSSRNFANFLWYSSSHAASEEKTSPTAGQFFPVNPLTSFHSFIPNPRSCPTSRPHPFPFRFAPSLMLDVSFTHPPLVSFPPVFHVPLPLSQKLSGVWWSAHIERLWFPSSFPFISPVWSVSVINPGPGETGETGERDTPAQGENRRARGKND